MCHSIKKEVYYRVWSLRHPQNFVNMVKYWDVPHNSSSLFYKFWKEKKILKAKPIMCMGSNNQIPHFSSILTTIPSTPSRLRQNPKSLQTTQLHCKMIDVTLWTSRNRREPLINFTKIWQLYCLELPPQ